MHIVIQKAKNGEDTALAEGHFLHSNYAPSKEAERFVQNLKLPYTPSSIILIEPALSYQAKYLRKYFPGVRVGAIRLCKDFSTYDGLFDFVIEAYGYASYETLLESKLSEEELLGAYFLDWQPSAQIFSVESRMLWQAIKNALTRAKTLLITRQYFEKKWFLNSIRFIKYLHNTVSFDSLIDKDTLIISSGPSLKPFINFIKENQNSFFIICLSSAISICIKNGIIPDLCMTTDGGYWASQHLKKLEKTDLPLAMPAEAYCPPSLLSKLKVLPLSYSDGISEEVIKSQNIVSKKAVRNGTVSGTAMLFAAEYCNKNIYMTGLDMAGQKGFQHTQPNELEANAAYKDNRLKTKESRMTAAGLPGGSLEIYRDWFKNFSFNSGNRKLYRLIEEKDRKNSLGQIEDINLKKFSSLIKKERDKKQYIHKTETCKNDFSEVIKLLENPEKLEIWKKGLFPLDYLSLVHNPSNTEAKEKIEKEWQKLLKKTGDILHDNL